MNAQALTIKQLSKIRDEAELQIQDLKDQRISAGSRMAKNIIDARILNRASISQRCSELITQKSL